MSVSGAISFLRLSFFFRGGRKVVPVHDHLQLVVPGPAPAGVVVLAHNIRCQMCLSQTAGLLQWLRSELVIFSCCPSSQCRARIEPVSIAAQSSATTFRQRSMFPVFYTRRHLFCRHSFLQHWSVRLALEWMTCFSWKTHRICIGRPFALDLFLYDCCRPVRG